MYRCAIMLRKSIQGTKYRVVSDCEREREYHKVLKFSCGIWRDAFFADSKTVWKGISRSWSKIVRSVRRHKSKTHTVINSGRLDSLEIFDILFQLLRFPLSPLTFVLELQIRLYCWVGYRMVRSDTINFTDLRADNGNSMQMAQDYVTPLSPSLGNRWTILGLNNIGIVHLTKWRSEKAKLIKMWTARILFKFIE